MRRIWQSLLTRTRDAGDRTANQVEEEGRQHSPDDGTSKA